MKDYVLNIEKTEKGYQITVLKYGTIKVYEITEEPTEKLYRYIRHRRLNLLYNEVTSQDVKDEETYKFLTYKEVRKALNLN